MLKAIQIEREGNFPFFVLQEIIHGYRGRNGGILCLDAAGKYGAYPISDHNIVLKSHKYFIKCIKLGTYFVHKPFTKVNIHPSEVNLTTFIQRKPVL